jgi:hypothetical protein
MTASDAHFTNIARNASQDAREIRARRSGNYKAMNKIRESVFTGSFLTQNSSNMYHNFSTDL